MMRWPRRKVWKRSGMVKSTSASFPGVSGSGFSQLERNLARKGIGFGLGFSVVIDPAALRVTCSAGEYGWGGAASTEFWVDPAEELTVLFFTQLLPSGTYPIRRELKQLVYSGEIVNTCGWDRGDLPSIPAL